MRCPICKNKINVKPRSNNQSRYYWGQVVDPIASETGHSPAEIHEILKQMFIPKETIKLSGVEYIVPRSSTELSTREFEEFLAQIRAWAGIELRLKILLPHEGIE